MNILRKYLIDFTQPLLFFLIGPVVGSWLYTVGGFTAPFIVVGSVGIILQVFLMITLPNVHMDFDSNKNSAVENNNNENEPEIKSKKTLTLMAMLKVLKMTL